MNQTKTNHLALLLLLAVNISILTVSCAQEPPQCCEIIALERQIEGIESLSRVLFEKDRPNDIFYSVWQRDDFAKPSDDPNFNKACDPQSNKKPLVDMRYKKERLMRLRDNALDRYLTLLEDDQCSKSVGLLQGMEAPATGGNTANLPGSEAANKEGQVESVDPQELSLGPITYDRNAQFDIMELDYGRKNPKGYICVIFDPKAKDYGLDFLYNSKVDGKWERFGSFHRAAEYLKNSKRDPAMLMNAGIFSMDFKPLGMFYRNSRQMTGLNTKKGLGGNFYMDPGGVFAIKEDGSAKIVTRDYLEKNIKDTASFRYATQSGPMLVIDGKLHPEFKSGSANKHIRNGVGVTPDGKIIFAISKDEVNFFEFALLFRDGFQCKEALYLDGTISKIYAPSIKRMDVGGDFAGIIAIYKKRQQ